MTFEQAKEDIKRRHLREFVPLEERKGNFFVCPICHSGEGPKKTAALKIDPRTYHVTCFSQGCFGDKGEDTPGALMKIWNCGLREVLTRAGYEIDQDHTRREARSVTTTATTTANTPVKREPIPEPTTVDHTADYKKWNKNLLNDPDVLNMVKGWGITEDSIKRFMIGYAPAWSHPKTPQYKSARIIFPRSADTYSARVADRTFTGERKYQVVGKQSRLFNVNTLKNNDQSDEPVVVVEGEIDAIVQIQLGIRVVGLGSTSNKNVFIEAAKALAPTAAYILALDNDPQDSHQDGQKTQEDIAKALDDAGIAYIRADTNYLYNGMKDAGAAVPADPDGFMMRLSDYYAHAYEMRDERDKAAEAEAYAQSGPGMVDAFLQEIHTSRFKPISSGIQSLDRALGGGFVRQSVVLLGAATGMGKTALISQICENMVQNDAGDVLYINLELSRQLLLARSIARISCQRGNEISAREVLRIAEYPDKDAAVAEAAQIYKETIAGHLIYNPGEPETNLDKIMEKITAEERRLGHAPIVVLDYLQLVTGDVGEDNISIIKKAMQTFKTYANENNTIVFIVVANNRDSNKSGQSDINSGRDSSNIEYGADVHMGIEYAAVSTRAVYEADKDGNGQWTTKKGVDIDIINAYKRAYLKMIDEVPVEFWEDAEYELEKKYEELCKKVSIRVNKNRLAESNATATLTFDGAASRFIEYIPTFTPKREKKDAPTTAMTPGSFFK